MINLASFLDSTNLKPEANEDDIHCLCMEAVRYEMAAVCINPYRLALAGKLLADSKVKLCTVIGFPLGADGLKYKIYSASMALDNGADELDLVINIGAVKDRNYKIAGNEIDSMLALKSKRDFIAKIIVETALLTEAELITLIGLINDSGADFIKTSTGFSSRGVSLGDINIINAYKSKHLQVKASGGIKSLALAMELLDLGVNRLGTSSATRLINEYKESQCTSRVDP
ncbi:MAG: deoxyribose-phosphate aldolase [Syntrophomonas sp.]|nr:deoxyribose-phosphate aldolase [Syntrophomonas sp.]